MLGQIESIVLVRDDRLAGLVFFRAVRGPLDPIRFFRTISEDQFDDGYTELKGFPWTYLLPLLMLLLCPKSDE